MSTDFLLELEKLLHSRKQLTTNQSYVANLYKKAPDAILKKIGEEATEVVMAAKDYEVNSNDGNQQNLVHESADLLFHLLVLLAHQNINLEAVIEELKKRHTNSHN